MCACPCWCFLFVISFFKNAHPGAVQKCCLVSLSWVCLVEKMPVTDELGSAGVVVPLATLGVKEQHIQRGRHCLSVGDAILEGANVISVVCASAVGKRGKKS